MNDIAPGIGHNRPDLAESLAEETKPFRERADALITSVNNSKIDSPETAAQVTTLGNLLATHRADVETARKEAAKPFDDGKATVQTVYARGILDPLDRAIGACRRMLDAWRDQQTALAVAEQRKRDAEAAEARRVAEEADRARREAEAAGDPAAALKAEMEAMQAAERAEKLESGEGTIRPDQMIRSQAGSASTATQRVPVVTNIGECLAWLIVNQPTALIESITPIIARLIRAKMTIPGVETREVATTRFRR